MIARVKPPGVKIILITDAGGLDRPDVQKGLAILDANDGEVWAKLDAGSEPYYRLINRSKISFAKILKNIAGCAKERPVVIQSLFLKIRGAGPTYEEITAYCDRLRAINSSGGRGSVRAAGDEGPSPSGQQKGIKLVQICTIARQPMTLVDGVPAWKFVSALSNTEVDAIRDRVIRETHLPAESFYGAASPQQ